MWGGPDRKGSNLGNFNLVLGSNAKYATIYLQDPGYVTKSWAAQYNGKEHIINLWTTWISIPAVTSCVTLGKLTSHLLLSFTVVLTA